jgi:hypothetical protein
MRRSAALAVATALVAAACGWVSRSVEVLDAVAAPDGLSLSLTVDSCGAELSTEVKEDAESVTVYVGARKGTDAECLDSVVVELEEPLGGRRLIDGYDFTLVEVRRDG